MKTDTAVSPPSEKKDRWEAEFEGAVVFLGDVAGLGDGVEYLDVVDDDGGQIQRLLNQVGHENLCWFERHEAAPVRVKITVERIDVDARLDQSITEFLLQRERTERDGAEGESGRHDGPWWILPRRRTGPRPM